jgi:two-component system, response regulator
MRVALGRVDVAVAGKGCDPLKDCLILVVEDDSRSAELVEAFLPLEGFTDEVVVTRDGVEAIDYLLSPERSAADMTRLVHLNLNMPRLDGFGILKKMRQEERTRFVPVVVLTSSDHPEDVRRVYELGANGYLDNLSEEVRWDEMVRAAARYWAGMNVTPYSLV